MRIEDCQTDERSGQVERSVRLSWIGGEKHLWVRVPEGLSSAADDLTPFVPVGLLLAMRRSEPLQIDGAVSPRLLAHLSLAQETLSAWDSTYARIRVRAAARAEARPRSAGYACCFSRGVDSTYSAVVGRPAGREFTHLVFCDSLELAYSPQRRREETVAAHEAALQIGKDLVVVSTNVHEVTDHVVDWEDAYGAALAMLGLSLAGGINRLVIPSTAGHGELIPHGSHPLLDPLWSSETVEVEHDSCAVDRAGKVRWLVEHRPELLARLQVCPFGDASRNCGRCAKCVLTMTLLHAAGGLEQASSFPPRVEPDDLGRARFPALLVRLHLNSVYRALSARPEDAQLKAAIADALRESARMPDDPSPYGIDRHQTRLFRAMETGTPFLGEATQEPAPQAEVGELDPSWAPPRNVRPGLLALAVSVDTSARRHAYAVQGVPAGSFVGELGAVLRDRPPGGVPLTLDDSGHPLVPGLERPRFSVFAAVRWTLAPLAWRGTSRLRRLRSAGRRALNTFRQMYARNPSVRSKPAVGWLHGSPGPGRLPLYAARHPVLDDVLLSTEAETAHRLRYRHQLLVGYLEAQAPLTGSLGVHRGGLPWAHRWGLLDGLTSPGCPPRS